VAQLDKAPAYGAGDCGFKSHRGHIFFFSFSLTHSRYLVSLFIFSLHLCGLIAMINVLKTGFFNPKETFGFVTRSQHSTQGPKHELLGW
jgi:hypothetical protein